MMATRLREVRSTRLSTRFQYSRISRASQFDLVGFEEGVIGQHLLRIAFRLEHDDRDVELVGADIEDRVVELARELAAARNRRPASSISSALAGGGWSGRAA